MKTNMLIRLLIVAVFISILNSLASCSVTVATPRPVVVVYEQRHIPNSHKKMHGHKCGKHHNHHGHKKHHRHDD